MTDQIAVDDREESFEDFFNELNDDAKTDDLNDALVIEDDDNDDDPVIQDDTISELDQLKQLTQKLQQERDHFEHSFKSQVGRVSALQKKIDSEAKPDDSEIDEELQGVLEEYPDIAKPIINFLEKKYKGIESRIEPIQQVEQQRQAQDEQRYIDHQLSILDKDNEGWRNTIASAEYLAWLDKQPVAVRQMHNSTEAGDYQYLLGVFNATQNKSADLTKRRQDKLAANVQIASAGVSKKSTAPDDFNAAWDFYANKK